MSPEWLTAIGTIGTFVVIAASAVAALIQLRHMRGSNQIVALTEVRETLESEAFQTALQHVASDLQRILQDPNARRAFLEPGRMLVKPEFKSARVVANFFESTGGLVKRGIIDPEIAGDLWGYVVLNNWRYLEPFITNLRVARKTPALYENFEYWAGLSERSRELHPHGRFPPGARRMPHSALWPEAAENTEMD